MSPIPYRMYAESNFDFFLVLLSHFNLSDFYSKDSLDLEISLFELGFSNENLYGCENSCLLSLFESAKLISTDQDTLKEVEELSRQKPMEQGALNKRRKFSINCSDFLKYIELILNDFRLGKIGLKSSVDQSYYNYERQIEIFDLFIESLLKKFPNSFKTNLDEFIECLAFPCPFALDGKLDTNLFLFDALIVDKIFKKELEVSNIVRIPSKHRVLEPDKIPTHVKKMTWHVLEGLTNDVIPIKSKIDWNSNGNDALNLSLCNKYLLLNGKVYEFAVNARNPQKILKGLIENNGELNITEFSKLIPKAKNVYKKYYESFITSLFNATNLKKSELETTFMFDVVSKKIYKK